MDEHAKYPRFTIVVCQDNVPVVMVVNQIDGPNTSAADVFYPDVEALQLAEQQFAAAQQTMAYLIWKETGILPAPPDMRINPPPGDHLPF